MSAGQFVISSYGASYDLAQIHPIRIQPETLAAQPTAPADPPTSPISARVSGSKRTLGLIARKVVLRDDLADPPEGYQPSGRLTIPILSDADFANITKGQTLTYLGVDMVVVGKIPEYVN